MLQAGPVERLRKQKNHAQRRGRRTKPGHTPSALSLPKYAANCIVGQKEQNDEIWDPTHKGADAVKQLEIHEAFPPESEKCFKCKQATGDIDENCQLKPKEVLEELTALEGRWPLEGRRKLGSIWCVCWFTMRD